MAKTAKFLHRIQGWTGDARLYRLSEPLDGREYVIVSAVVAPFSGPETFIFPATVNGEAIDMIEMEGSFKGGLDHTRALRGAGYAIERSED